MNSAAARLDRPWLSTSSASTADQPTSRRSKCANARRSCAATPSARTSGRASAPRLGRHIRRRRVPLSPPDPPDGQLVKEIITPQGPQGHRDGYYVEFTNLDTGVTWRVPGNPVTSFTFKPDGTFNPDGSVIQTVDGVWVAAGPLHTVYFGHWTRTFPDGVIGPSRSKAMGRRSTSASD